MSPRRLEFALVLRMGDLRLHNWHNTDLQTDCQHNVDYKGNLTHWPLINLNEILDM